MGLQKELEAKNLDGVIRELTENPSCIDDVTEKGVPLALYAAGTWRFFYCKVYCRIFQGKYEYGG